MHKHSHHHEHAHSRHKDKASRNKRRIALTLIFTTAYMVAEIVGGITSNSLALLADAGHMLSDVVALALSLFAIWIAQKPPNSRQSFGYHRAEILVALINGVTLIGISIVIFYEAIQRLKSPEPIEGSTMMLVALGGLAINIVGLALLYKGRSDNLNIKGAWLHVLMDTFGSIGVVLSGIMIWAFEMTIFDPIASMVISGLVIYSAWSLIKETVAVLMESAPGHIDPDLLREALLSTEGVFEIHDLHVWTIATGLESMSCHVIAQTAVDHPQLLYRLRHMLSDKFHLNHVTIQIENEGFEEQVHWHCQN